MDDVLAISYDAKQILLDIGQDLKFKGKIAPPDIYLGARLSKKTMNGHKCWTMNSHDYITAAIANLEERMKKRNIKLPTKAKTPLATNYSPELDNSPELDSEDITFYQELIGILRWGTGIGRVDVLHEVTLLSAYQAAPRMGHLEQLYHIFAYLKGKGKLTLYFDPALPRLDPNMFTGSSPESFRSIYRDAKEQIPGNAPQA